MLSYLQNNVTTVQLNPLRVNYLDRHCFDFAGPCLLRCLLALIQVNGSRVAPSARPHTVTVTTLPPVSSVWVSCQPFSSSEFSSKDHSSFNTRSNPSSISPRFLPSTKKLRASVERNFIETEAERIRKHQFFQVYKQSSTEVSEELQELERTRSEL